MLPTSHKIYFNSKCTMLRRDAYASIAAAWLLVFSSQVHGQGNGAIITLHLINADTDSMVADLTNGTVVDVSSIAGMSTPSFNINATYDTTVRSVWYWYNESMYNIEETAPYALCANNETDFFKCNVLNCGSHTVTAVPYSSSDAQGNAGAPYSVYFSIACPTAAPALPPSPSPVTPIAPTFAVSGLSLVNAANDNKVVDLANGTVVYIKDIPGMLTPFFNINATFWGKIGSVGYWYNYSLYHIEQWAPFAFCANNHCNFFYCERLGCGTHTVTATPYQEPWLYGSPGSPYTVTFSIDCSPNAAPPVATAAPIASAAPAPKAPLASAVPAPIAPTETPSTRPSSAPSPAACLGCKPSNACFTTSCKFTGKCIYTPVKTCPAGQSCDPKTGNCLSQNYLRPCIGVIDESSQTTSYVDAMWTEFRATYPDRPFCLLQPISSDWGDSSDGYGLYLPPSFLNDTSARHYNIIREDTPTPIIPSSPLPDWFDLCDIDVYAATGISFVGLYIDTSSSMTEETVANMSSNFIQKLNQSGLAYKTLLNPSEDWILPFLTDLSTL
jgi:hypothetical protein